MMKNIIKYISIAVLMLGFASCEQQFKAEVPEIFSFTVDLNPALVQTITTFSIEANADLAVIWSGDETSDYYAHLTSPSLENTGIAVNLEYDRINDIYVGSKKIIYSEPGTYKAVLVLTNIGDLGEVIEQLTEELIIVVEAASRK